MRPRGIPPVPGALAPRAGPCRWLRGQAPPFRACSLANSATAPLGNRQWGLRVTGAPTEPMCQRVATSLEENRNALGEVARVARDIVTMPKLEIPRLTGLDGNRSSGGRDLVKVDR